MKKKGSCLTLAEKGLEPAKKNTDVTRKGNSSRSKKGFLIFKGGKVIEEKNGLPRLAYR